MSDHAHCDPKNAERPTKEKPKTELPPRKLSADAGEGSWV
jgi:hypothetical protein